jgi:hypothetical protein
MTAKFNGVVTSRPRRICRAEKPQMIQDKAVAACDRPPEAPPTA